MSPVIFLDMDGVLCVPGAVKRKLETDEPPKGWRFSYVLCRDAVERLNKVAEEHGCIYVSSSTWRKEMPVGQLTKHLQRYGWRGAFHRHWKTPVINGPRGLEISAWLENNSGVDAYAIVDDGPSAGVGHPPSRFVQVNDWRDGFSDADAWTLRAALERKEGVVDALRAIARML